MSKVFCLSLRLREFSSKIRSLGKKAVNTSVRRQTMRYGRALAIWRGYSEDGFEWDSF